MSLITEEYFRCQHKKLTKKKYSNTYFCNHCDKEFTLIPAVHTPIFPKVPEYQPPDPQKRKPPGFTPPKYW